MIPVFIHISSYAMIMISRINRTMIILAGKNRWNLIKNLARGLEMTKNVDGCRVPLASTRMAATRISSGEKEKTHS